MQYYLYVTSVFFLWLGIIWNRKDMMNLTYKTVFILLAIYGGFLSMTTLGYIVKGVS